MQIGKAVNIYRFNRQHLTFGAAQIVRNNKGRSQFTTG